MKPRILILMSKTGSGHQTSAQALRDGFEELFPEKYEVNIIDLLTDYFPWPMSKAPRSYDFLAQKTPWLWRLLYEVSDDAMPAIDLTAARAFSRNVEKAIKDFQPDLIISVHPLFQHVSLRALKKLKMSIPFVTVVTDLTSQHPAWYHAEVTRCFVPNEKAAQTAKEYGLTDEQIYVSGLPIRPSFAQHLQKKPHLKTKLGLDPSLPTVLIYGIREKQTEVMATVGAIAQELHEHKTLGQILVMCGQDKKLQSQIENHDWPVPIKTTGFVNNMHEWMSGCDCIVAKAGPGVISESMACGLPMIINSFIPGQETENIPYVIDKGIGVYNKNPEEVATIIARWFTDDHDQLNEMSKKAKQLSNPKATFNIVNEIVKLFDQAPAK